jgi:hypothetical protein
VDERIQDEKGELLFLEEKRFRCETKKILFLLYNRYFGPYGDRGAITNSVIECSLSSTVIKNPPLLVSFYTGTIYTYTSLTLW